jgi:ethanolamine permease
VAASDIAPPPAPPGGFVERKLSRVAGPLLLWGLGVGYVISGDYYGWNFGLTATGYWGFLVALALMAVLYAAMAGVISELAAAIPHAGGPYAFARMALGRVGGYICGVGVLIEYVIAPVAVALAIGAYINVEIVKIPVIVCAIAVYAISTTVHYFGAGNSLKLELGLTALALVGLVIFYAVGIPKITGANLNAVGDGKVFPEGLSGLWSALPLAAWFFLAIEALPMASEESKDPAKDMPKALKLAFLTLAAFAILTLTVSAGLGGAAKVGEADAPLPVAIQLGIGRDTWSGNVVSWLGLAGLGASFHGIVMAYSRQTFALARTGYLPRFLAHVSARDTPTWSLIAPGIIGIALVIIGYETTESAIPVMVTMSVFGAAISYMLMMASAIVLRRKRPDLARPYKVPGGQITAGVAFVLAAILLPAGMKDYPAAMAFGAATFVAFLVYFFAYSHKNIVSNSIEEELALLAEADSKLK